MRWVTAALNGELEKAEFVTDPYFGVAVPTSCPNVPEELMIPANTWKDKAAYEAKAKELARSFVENFKKYNKMPADVVAAGPRCKHNIKIQHPVIAGAVFCFSTE